MKKIIGTIIIAVIAVQAIFAQSDKSFEMLKNLEIYSNTYKNLELFYVDEIQPGSLMKIGIDAMLKSLDPYTVFYPESDIEDVKMLTEGQYDGIGCTIFGRDGKVIISSLMENKPAHKAGLLVGDVILEIDGIKMQHKTSEEVSSLLKGQVNSTTVITLERIGEKNPLKINVKREKIKIDNVASSKMFDNHIGYISLSGFMEKAYSEFKKSYDLLKQQGMNKLIIDLRSNGGGLMGEAINIISMFVPQNTLAVSMRGKSSDRNQDFFTKQAPVDTAIPIIVLLDGMSASASEILAGTLQDLDRAVVMGQTSFGKGLVQNVIPVAYNAQMKITTAKYYIPSGRCVQAIDYEHRDANGKALRLPDSLRSLFYTKKGRPVYDGLGIEPDVKLDVPEIPDVLLMLTGNYLVFDFANEYFRNHKLIASADKFELSQSDYDNFIQFVKKSDNNSYQTNSELSIQILEETAKEEGYYEVVKEQINALKEAVKNEKANDFEKHKKLISEYLSGEIVSRYYLQSGMAEYNFKTDGEIKSACGLLLQPDKIREILK
ncbi:MAG: S41 family peptidase [Bacteroidales bacterium]|jgi:carboxyl-terminal processing protease|nr:S41 family peptidase [Bacteroidales bacterium]